MSKQAKRYVFTINNYDNDILELLAPFYENHCKYLVYGKEVGANLTPHLQGFFTLKDKLTMKGVHKALGFSALHLEPAKGTSLQASDYCKKDGDFIEFGTPPFQGKRTDLDAQCAAINEGKSMADVADMAPATYVRNYRGLAAYQNLKQADYNHTGPRGIWIYGPPGSGKSFAARSISSSMYMKPQNKWFDGYAGESHILLDDLDTGLLGHHLKLWNDEYAVSAETKGGTVKLTHECFIVTSNFTIEELWDDQPKIRDAIKRRFEVIHLPNIYKRTTPLPPNAEVAKLLTTLTERNIKAEYISGPTKEVAEPEPVIARMFKPLSHIYGSLPFPNRPRTSLDSPNPAITHWREKQKKLTHDKVIRFIDVPTISQNELDDDGLTVITESSTIH
jgi:Putative viral replication protein/RNA helicase